MYVSVKAEHLLARCQIGSQRPIFRTKLREKPARWGEGRRGAEGYGGGVKCPRNLGIGER